MFKYKTNNTEGSASNVIRETRAVPVMDKVKEGMLLRPVDIEHTDEFGTYKLRLLHDISGTFIYKTGSRGTLAETILIARNFLVSTNESPDGYWSSYIPSPVSDPSGAATFNTYYKLSSYSVKNGYKLPDYHRLDIGMNYHLYHKKGQSTINFSIYNLYNHLNIYSVYPASEGCNNALKGLCLFPFLPSLSYTYSF